MTQKKPIFITIHIYRPSTEERTVLIEIYFGKDHFFGIIQKSAGFPFTTILFCVFFVGSVGRDFDEMSDMVLKGAEEELANGHFNVGAKQLNDLLNM